MSEITERELGGLLKAALTIDGTTRARLTRELAERRCQEALWQGYTRVMRQSSQSLQNILALSNAAVALATRR